MQLRLESEPLRLVQFLCENEYEFVNHWLVEEIRESCIVVRVETAGEIDAYVWAHWDDDVPHTLQFHACPAHNRPLWLTPEVFDDLKKVALWLGAKALVTQPLGFRARLIGLFLRRLGFELRDDMFHLQLESNDGQAVQGPSASQDPDHSTAAAAG